MVVTVMNYIVLALSFEVVQDLEFLISLVSVMSVGASFLRTLSWVDLIWAMSFEMMNHLCCWCSCSIFCHRFIGYSFSSVYSLYQCVTFFMFGYTEFYDHEIGYHWNSLTFILKYIYWLYNRSPLLSLMWMVIVF